jgi:hypothetical protein
MIVEALYGAVFGRRVQSSTKAYAILWDSNQSLHLARMTLTWKGPVSEPRYSE